MSQITEENYKSFKEKYEKAVSNGDTLFRFEGQQVLTRFAKYVIEYFSGLKKS